MKKSLVMLIILMLCTSSVFAQSRITVLLEENFKIKRGFDRRMHQRVLCIDGYKYIQTYIDNGSSSPTLIQMYENNPSMTPRLATCKN